MKTASFVRKFNRRDKALKSTIAKYGFAIAHNYHNGLDYFFELNEGIVEVSIFLSYDNKDEVGLMLSGFSGVTLKRLNTASFKG